MSAKWGQTVVFLLFILMVQDAFAWGFPIIRRIRDRQHRAYNPAPPNQHTTSEDADRDPATEPLRSREVVEEEPTENTEKVSVTKYVWGRFVGEEFQYFGGGETWVPIPKTNWFIANEEGSFKNDAGEEVTYKSGDIIFQTETYGSFKAKADTPKVTAPIEQPQIVEPEDSTKSYLQQKAQLRAQQMADMRLMRGHLKGAVFTYMGTTYYEGVGRGEMNNPGTCISTDGSAPVADAKAKNGTYTFRVRFYTSPTYNPDGRRNNRQGLGWFGH